MAIIEEPDEAIPARERIADRLTKVATRCSRLQLIITPRNTM